MVTSWRDYPAGITGRTEKRLLEWFEREAGEGETWLDIGAHYGYTTLALARMTGPSGRVYAFEPFFSLSWAFIDDQETKSPFSGACNSNGIGQRIRTAR